MSQFLPFLVLVMMASCSTTKSQERRQLAWESWKGRSTEELRKHPYFKTLPVKKLQNQSDIETWVYHDQSRFQSDSYCQSLGGCQGMQVFNCNSAFSVKHHKILALEQTGTCPGTGVIKPKDM